MQNDVLGKAITSTGMPEQGATDTTEEMPMDDGTATIPLGILPEETAEGDIVQMEVVMKDDNGIVLKPVESRIKQPGVTNKDVKAAGTDNSSVGTQPDKMGMKPTL